MKGLQRTQMRVHLSSHHLLLQINSLYWSEFSLNSCFLNEKCNYSFLNQFCSDQSLSDAQLFATPWTAARQASLSMTNSWACSNLCPLSRWFHPAISSSAVPFFSSLQSSLASGSFPVSQFFASGGQSIGALSSASVLPMNIQDWFPLGWTGLISLLSKGLSRVFSNTTVQKHQFFSTQLSLWSNSHIHTWLLEKP